MSLLKWLAKIFGSDEGCEKHTLDDHKYFDYHYEVLGILDKERFDNLHDAIKYAAKQIKDGEKITGIKVVRTTKYRGVNPKRFEEKEETIASIYDCYPYYP